MNSGHEELHIAIELSSGREEGDEYVGEVMEEVSCVAFDRKDEARGFVVLGALRGIFANKFSRQCSFPFRAYGLIVQDLFLAEQPGLTYMIDEEFNIT